MTENISFREVQRAHPLFLTIGFIGSSLPIVIFAWAMIQQCLLEKPFGDPPMSNTALAILGTVIILLSAISLILICFSRLIIEVRPDGLRVQFAPIHLRPKYIAIDQVLSIIAIKYRPIREYGGWGIRWTSKGKAYNARGNGGVRLNYADGRHLLIGSQHPEELARAIESLRQETE